MAVEVLFATAQLNPSGLWLHKSNMNWILAAAGGAVGALLRFGLSEGLSRLVTAPWPTATFVANVSGGLAMGLLWAWVSSRSGAAGEPWRVFLGVGVLGGFTTFSAFSLEVAQLVERRALGLALIYALASVAFAVAAVFAGLALARRSLA